MGRHRGKSKKAKKPKALAPGTQIWLDEASTVPEDFVPTVQARAFIYTTKPEADWVRDTVQEYFKRGKHGL